MNKILNGITALGMSAFTTFSAQGAEKAHDTAEASGNTQKISSAYIVHTPDNRDVRVDFERPEDCKDYKSATIGLTPERVGNITNQKTLVGAWKALGDPELMDDPVRQGRGALYNQFSQDFFEDLDRRLSSTMTVADLLESSQAAYEYAYAQDLKDGKSMVKAIGVQPLLSVSIGYQDIIIKQGDGSILNSPDLKAELDMDSAPGYKTGLDINLQFKPSHQSVGLLQGVVSGLGNGEVVSLDSKLSELNNPLVNNEGAISIQYCFRTSDNGVIPTNDGEEPLNVVLAND